MQALLISLFTLLCIITGSALIVLVNGQKTLRSGMGMVSLAFLLGTGVSSLLVFLVELIQLPITATILWGIQSGFVVLALWLKRKAVPELFRAYSVMPGIADLLPILIALAFGVISFWRSFYFPPYSYDSLLGIDLIAKYAVRDGSIAGSALFETLLPLTKSYGNQLFYAPYAMLMQVLTRGIGIDFGQVWLGLLSFFFYLFFYAAARQHAHAAMAFAALLFIIFVPEFYAYSFILQTDYSNAVFFFIGVYFFYRYSQENLNSTLALACTGMFLACWSRTETIFFMPFGSLWLLIAGYLRNRVINWQLIKSPLFFTAIPAIAVFLWSILYKGLYLPDTVSLAEQIQLKSGNLAVNIGQHFREMNAIVIFKNDYWNYSLPIFLLFVLAGLLFALFKKKLPLGLEFLFWILVIYLGFHLLLLTFPAVNIPFTFRRGFFKIIPLMGFYLALGDMSALISGKPKT